MTPYENFPTPADVIPEAFATPPLDPEWEASMMDEIAAFLYKKRGDFQAKKQVRFIPQAKRDMGASLKQWLHYHKKIADQVRERGWVVMIVENGTYPVLSIAMPDPKSTKMIVGLLNRKSS